MRSRTLTGEVHLLAITYETGGEYLAAAERLAASATAHDLVLKIYSREDRGMWWKNVLNKTGIIAKTLAASAQPVLYLDADCEIVASVAALPAMLQDADLVLRHREASAHERYNTGVMLLANNQRVRLFVDRWHNLVQAYGQRCETCDQGLVDEAIAKSNLRVKPLPIEYNTIASDPAIPRIRHRKMSRENPELSSWKSLKRLESKLCDRTAEMLAKPAAPVTYLWGPEPPSLPNLQAADELQLVDRSMKTDRAFVLWLSTLDTLLDCECDSPYLVMATDVVDGNVSAGLRFRLQPKPHVDALPPKIALFYPSLTPVTTFNRRELCSATIWASAMNALALRKAKVVVVACPDGMRTLVQDLAHVFRFKLSFA